MGDTGERGLAGRTVIDSGGCTLTSIGVISTVRRMKETLLSTLSSSESESGSEVRKDDGGKNGG